jgi:hypothetical protein
MGRGSSLKEVRKWEGLSAVHWRAMSEASQGLLRQRQPEMGGRRLLMVIEW